MRKRLLILVLVILLAAPLVPVLRGFAHHVIAVPLLRVVWLGRILYESMPQLPVWALSVAVALLIAVRTLVSGKGFPRRSTQVQVSRPGRIQALSERIQRAAEGEYYQWALEQHLGGFILDMLALQEGTTPGQMRQRLKAGRLDAPPEILAFLQDGLTLRASWPNGLFAVLWHRLRSRVQTVPLDPDLESLVQCLEKKLEV